MNKKSIYILFASICLTSCMPVIFGATAAGGAVSIQNRSIGTTVDDYSIWTKITTTYFREDLKNLFKDVDVKVKAGRVLLTGKVNDPEIAIKAVQIAWEQKNVSEVINEIKSEEYKKINIRDYSLDAWITTQVKAKLMFEKNIHSINFNVETLDKTVYLFGIAKDQDEIDLINHIASITMYVEHVISHIKLEE